MFRCAACGATEQGPPRARAEASRERAERGRGGRGGRERRALDQGSVENPVIDSEMARLLRERFSGD